MKGLSLWQPRATLIALEAKRIETRSWGTPYRGELLICATANTPASGWEALRDRPFIDVLPRAGYPNQISFPQGAAVALVRLAECRQILRVSEDGYYYRQVHGPHRDSTIEFAPFSTLPERAFGDYRECRYAWHLEDIRPLPQPLKCKGGQCLWYPAVETRQKVYRALGMTAEAEDLAEDLLDRDINAPAIGSLFATEVKPV